MWTYFDFIASLALFSCKIRRSYGLFSLEWGLLVMSMSSNTLFFTKLIRNYIIDRFKQDIELVRSKTN